MVAYNSLDPGALAVNLALAGLTQTSGEAAQAAGFAQQAGALAPFALDQTCLSRNGLPSTGAPGNGLSGLSQDLQVIKLNSSHILEHVVGIAVNTPHIWEYVRLNSFTDT